MRIFCGRRMASAAVFLASTRGLVAASAVSAFTEVVVAQMSLPSPGRAPTAFRKPGKAVFYRASLYCHPCMPLLKCTTAKETFSSVANAAICCGSRELPKVVGEDISYTLATPARSLVTCR